MKVKMIRMTKKEMSGEKSYVVKPLSGDKSYISCDKSFLMIKVEYAHFTISTPVDHFLFRPTLAEREMFP